MIGLEGPAHKSSVWKRANTEILKKRGNSATRKSQKCVNPYIPVGMIFLIVVRGKVLIFCSIADLH